MVDRIDVALLQESAARIATIAEHLRQDLAEMMRDVDKLQEGWTGDAADAFRTRLTDSAQTATELNDLLAAVADTLRHTAEHYTDVEQHNRSALG